MACSWWAGGGPEAHAQLPCQPSIGPAHDGIHERVVLGPGSQHVARWRRAALAGARCQAPPPAAGSGGQAAASGTGMWRCVAREAGNSECQEQPSAPGHFSTSSIASGIRCHCCYGMRAIDTMMVCEWSPKHALHERGRTALMRREAPINKEPSAADREPRSNILETACGLFRATQRAVARCAAPLVPCCSPSSASK